MNRVSLRQGFLWGLLIFFSGPSLAKALVLGDEDWAVYGGDPEGTKFTSLDQINRENVNRLELAWVYRAGDSTSRSTIECNPLAIDGILYITTAALKVVALDGGTGQELWVFDPFEGRRARGVNRGLAFHRDEDGSRLFHCAGTFVHALDPKSGEEIKTFGDEGRVDLRTGFDQDLFYLSIGSSSPGIVYQDLLIMGSTVGEGPGPTAPGHIRALNVHTGEWQWIFHTIPHPGELGYDSWPKDAWKTAGGANAWGGFTLDPERGLVFFGTGSPTYDHWGGDRLGANLFGNCIVALNAQTGERVWHYQVVHHDLWDYDLPCAPNLVTVDHEGARIDAIAQVSKMGLVFVLNRETGEPLFPIEEKPVPPSLLPGEEAWPTQPFPTKPPPYAQQILTVNEATQLNKQATQKARERLGEMVTGPIYIPPGLKDSVVLPQFNGGSNWGGGAVDPHSGVLFINASNEAEWISMVKSRPEVDITYQALGRNLYRAACSFCHGLTDTEQNQFGSLSDVHLRMTREEVSTLLDTGRGAMPSYESMTPIERKAILAFLFKEGSKEKVKLPDSDDALSYSIPYIATGHTPLRDPEGYPINQRPWGTLSAIDLNRGEILWQSVLGTYPELESKGIAPTGTFNIGGPLTTAGGLVFIGAAMDERFHAFDMKTGELVWEYQMEAGGYATPSSYAADGKQFIVIAAGGGGKPGTRSGDFFYAFRLSD